jgi:hypothetical protein
MIYIYSLEDCLGIPDWGRLPDAARRLLCGPWPRAGFVAKAARSDDTQDDIEALKSRVDTLESDLSDAERKAEDAESAAE